MSDGIKICGNCAMFKRHPNKTNYLKDGVCRFKMPGWEDHLYRPAHVNETWSCNLFRPATLTAKES